MTGDQTPRRPDSASGANAGWTAVSYLLSGIGVWGFFGWLVDRWLHLPGYGLFFGMVLGAGLAVYLVMKRMSG